MNNVMKPENSSNTGKAVRRSASDKKLISRREALNKAGLIALSATTMMVLMKSQPAMATSALPTPPPSSAANQEWRRTTRT
jgi:hypothetical protein